MTGLPPLSRLPRRIRPALRAARALARQRGSRLYLVGGVVRDMLLERPIDDVDLLVEQGALDFAQRLGRILGASFTLYERFLTSTVLLSDGDRLDIAQMRSETYSHPGALPTVRAPATLEEDLARRDFTINAMALEVSPGRHLADPFSGRSDLSGGTIRALHPRSFLDDPTRAFRAVRYANRLGFVLAPATRRQIGAAVDAGAFDRVSGDRLRREMERIFEEPRRAAAARRLSTLGLGRALDPALLASPRAVARLRAAESIASRYPGKTTWLCYLFASMSDADENAAERVALRLALAGGPGRRLRAWPGVRRRLGVGASAWPPSALAREARGLHADEIVALAAGAGAADRRCLLEHGGLRRQLELEIRGADLRAAGVPAGPAIGLALDATLAAREDGRIRAREELPFALRAARKHAP